MIWTREKIKETKQVDLAEGATFWSLIRSHESLRTLFIKYGRHKDNCYFGKTAGDGRTCVVCVCGLTAELERLAVL